MGLKSLQARQVLLCFAIAIQAMAASGITIKENNISIQDALAAVKQQANVFVMYENGVVSDNQRISLDRRDAPLQTAMDAICDKVGLHYEIKGQYVLITRINNLSTGNSGDSRVTGRVMDENGEPLAGVTVVIAGKAAGTVSNIDGYYSLKANKGDRLKFRYIGMHPAEFT